MERNNLLENVCSEANCSNNTSPRIQNLITPSKENKINLLCCRICFEDENSGELIDPCECSGSSKLVHTKCLEKWLSISNTDQCEICKYTFSILKKDKPIHQSLYQWWNETKALRWRGIVADLICLIVLTPLCSAACYMCGLGATTYTRMKIWEGFGLAMLCCMLMGTYFLWLFIILRFHYRSWRHWCNLNKDITVLVKHRDVKQSRKREIPIKRNRSNEENPFIAMNPIFPWFSTYRSSCDAVYNLHPYSTYV